MATTKPRITVTLTEKQHDVLRSISANSSQSMSAFVSDLIEHTLPVLERMEKAFKNIKTAQESQKKRIADELERAQTAVEPVLNVVLGQFDEYMTKVEKAAGVGDDDGKRSAAASPTPTPPRTNRGATGKRRIAEEPDGAGISSDLQSTTKSKKSRMATTS